jgi:hypothetical protein
MSRYFDRSKHLLGWLLLALIMLCAQQAAQLHALAHAQDQLAQPHKSKPASHPIEHCIAFHAIDSALAASAALLDFDFQHTEGTPWFCAQASPPSVYRLAARAPPRSV